MKQEEFDEFYGRDRATEIGFLSKTVKDIASTLPEAEKTALENSACHLHSAIFDVAREMFNLMLLSPTDKYDKLLEETMDHIGFVFASNEGHDNTPRHPDLDFDEDFEKLDQIFIKLSRKFSKKYC